MAEHKACQVVRRHLLGITWPPVPVSNEDLQQLAKSSESPSPSALLDLAEAARWRGEEGKVATYIQSASPGLNVPTPTDDTVVDIIRSAVLYESSGKFEEASISLSRASKTLAKVATPSAVLPLVIDVASLILAVKTDAFQELKVKQMTLFGALSKLPESSAVGYINALVGDFFLTLGKWSEAESLYSQALKILAKTAPSDPASAEVQLALASVQISRGKFVDASKSLSSIASTSSQSVINWAALLNARILHAQGRFGESQEAADKALLSLRSGPDVASLAFSSAVIDVASMAVQRGELLKANELLASVAALGKHGATNSLTLDYVLVLVSLRMRQGAIKEAESLLVDKLTAQKNRKGPASEFVVVAPLLLSLASVYVDSGRAEDAEALVTDTLSIRRKVFGEDHIALLPDLQLHARTLMMCGHETASEALWKRVITIASKASLGAPSLLLGAAHTLYGQALAQRGSDKAEASIQEGRTVRAKAVGDAPCAFLAESDVLLAEHQLAFEQLAKAKELARAAVASAKAAGAMELQSSALLCLSRSLSERENVEREASAETAWVLRRERQGPAAPRTLEALLAVVSAYDAQSKMEEATALLQFALRALKKERPEMDDPMIVHILHQLALHYWDMEQSEEAVALATQSVDLCKRLYGPSHPLTAAVLDGAAMIYDDAEMSNEAEEAKQEATAIRQQLGHQP